MDGIPIYDDDCPPIFGGSRIPILDHGYLEFIESWGSDERIVESARMSTDKGFIGWGSPSRPGDEKLLMYLWDNHHTSPFEQAGLTIEVQAPIMVFREWHRHRTQSYNELSGRYAQMPDVHYLPSLERIKGPSKHNKQGSDGEIPLEVKLEFRARLAEEQQLIYQNYEWALANGIAKEVARVDTPISRYSKMRASGNLWNWLHFLQLRQAPTAQQEIRDYADAMATVMDELFPRTMTLFRGAV